jgi:Family of unknown function (DUF6516)
MDISKLYEDQRARAMATFPDIVSEARMIRFDSGEPLKLRIEIIDGSIGDIFYSVTGKSSYHWERSLIDGSIYGHDNAPHKRWQSIKTFPKHFIMAPKTPAKKAISVTIPAWRWKSFWRLSAGNWRTFHRRVVLRTGGDAPGPPDEMPTRDGDDVSRCL